LTLLHAVDRHSQAVRHATYYRIVKCCRQRNVTSPTGVAKMRP